MREDSSDLRAPVQEELREHGGSEQQVEQSEALVE